MKMTTTVHAACLAEADLIRIAHNTVTVAAAISTDRNAHSTSRDAIYLLLSRRSRANVSSFLISSVLSTFASTMPLTSSSTEP